MEYDEKIINMTDILILKTNANAEQPLWYWD